MFNKKKYTLISSYIDNELDNEDKLFVESKINSDPEWKTIYDSFIANKKALQNLVSLPENDYLTGKILERIETRKNTIDSFLPIPRKYAPLAFSLVITAIIFVTLFVFQRKSYIETFFRENTDFVKNIYETTFSNNDLYPINSSLSNEEVFKFAVYGILPSEDENGKVIEVGSSEKKGYFVELAEHKSAPKSKEKVSLGEIYSKLQVLPEQRENIENVLEFYKQGIESSVLASPNKYIAVDANIWQFQKVVVAEIADNLNSKQRDEFYQLTGNPYTTQIRRGQDIKIRDSIMKVYTVSSHKPREFIVIKPDTLMVKRLNIDYDSIRLKVEKMRENNIKINFEFDNILRTTREKNHFTVEVTSPKSPERRKNSHKYRAANRIGVAFSIDSSVFRVEIPDIDEIISDRIVWTAVAEKDLKNLKKLKEFKKHQNFQKNFEKQFREARKFFNGTIKIEENRQDYKIRKIDSMFRSNKRDSIHKFIKDDADLDINIDLSRLKDLNKMFDEGGFINSIIKSSVNEENRHQLDSIMKNIKVDSIINSSLKGLKMKKGKIKFNEE